jgi:hypothetical protein
LLFELSKSEGWGNWQETKINGKPVTVNQELFVGLPTAGIFEGSYVCPVEKEKHEVRVKLGVKYLGWPAPDMLE